MDYFTLRASMTEFKQKYIGCRIHSCFQPDCQRFVFRIVPLQPEEPFRCIVFDTTLPFQGMYVTTEMKSDKEDQTLLARSFKKKTAGSRISDISMPIPDRLVCFTLSMAQWRQPRKLWFEMNVTPANLILTDSESSIILECLTKSPIDKNPQLARMPGLTFKNKLISDSQLPLTQDNCQKLITNSIPDKLVWKQLLQSIHPMSPSLAKRIVHFYESKPEEVAGEFINRISAQLMELAFHPRLLKANNRFVIDVLDIEESESIVLDSDSVLDLAAYYLTQIPDVQRIARERIKLESILNQKIQRINRSLEAAKKDLESLPDEDFLRKRANLLSANFHAVKPGMTEIKLLDIYESSSSARITVPLDPAFPLSIQINRMFKRAAKISRSKPLIGKRIESLQTMQRYFIALKLEVSRTDSLESIDLFRLRLDDLGLIQTQGSKRVNRTLLLRKPYLRFNLPGGWLIFVGRGAKENSELTFHHAKPMDFWLHAKGYRGAHVVIRNPGRLKQPPPEIAQSAARLAVYYSKARGEKAVSVILTRCNHVRKSPDGVPGKAIVVKHDTITVDSPVKSELPVQSISSLKVVET